MVASLNLQHVIRGRPSDSIRHEPSDGAGIRRMKRRSSIRSMIAFTMALPLLAAGCAVPGSTAPTLAPETTTQVAVPALQRARVEAHLRQTLRDLELFWANAYESMGVPFAPTPRAVFTRPGGTADHACFGGPTPDPYGAFFCPADRTIYISLEMERRIVFGDRTTTLLPDGAIGWFPTEWVIAHEYAHGVQADLGLPLGAISKPSELQADCLAGVFFAWREEFFTGSFGVDEISQALTVMYAVGDYEFDHPDHHGTPIERQAAFIAGWREGQPSECIAMNPWP